MNKQDLCSLVLRNVKQQVEMAAREGQWSVDIYQLRREHAQILVDEGLKVNPSPDDHDYETFSKFTVSWD